MTVGSLLHIALYVVAKNTQLPLHELPEELSTDAARLRAALTLAPMPHRADNQLMIQAVRAMEVDKEVFSPELLQVIYGRERMLFLRKSLPRRLSMSLNPLLAGHSGRGTMAIGQDGTAPPLNLENACDLILDGVRVYYVSMMIAPFKGTAHDIVPVHLIAKAVSGPKWDARAALMRDRVADFIAAMASTRTVWTIRSACTRSHYWPNLLVQVYVTFTLDK